MSNYRFMLKEQYGIEATEITTQQGGWSALAYKVHSNQNYYFLKVYEKSRASTPKWTALIDQYVPIIQWLAHHTDLQRKIPIPILTKNSTYKYEDDSGVYQLFAYIEGTTIGQSPLSHVQIRQLAEMVSELHRHGEEIPMDTDAIKEDFKIPYLPALKEALAQDANRTLSDVKELVAPYLETMQHQIAALEGLSYTLQSSNMKMRLCHTDIHNWNLMQSNDELILIDWEGLKLAPVEADLMFLVDEPYFDEFMAGYVKIHSHFTINHDALMFYQLRRKLEDIWEFIEQILYDDLPEQDRVEVLSSIKKELEGIF
ncbi:aminoglycoside phosphotransferase family protein [Paenibacillus sp. SC116]|uniref:aminoglycoside phosphotransferase family protein n=1 Tax=Paenibacillus sp. SC116 TaxID=2968986 RepID=UPI00215A3F53|nr:aminoglycoside phosphotransferase family protein [Paenibacillus sp. SC116]MCR8842360.1 aminoglycoside phosphotransferase family protein [Paenibacillus sp. SC116]